MLSRWPYLRALGTIAAHAVMIVWGTHLAISAFNEDKPFVAAVVIVLVIAVAFRLSRLLSTRKPDLTQPKG